jgi:hypothetical protein
MADALSEREKGGDNVAIQKTERVVPVVQITKLG